LFDLYISKLNNQMSSKYFISVILLFLIFLNVFSQNELLEHNHSDDIICKFHKTGNTNPSKSIINYNPRVFYYDVKFYKLDLEQQFLKNRDGIDGLKYFPAQYLSVTGL